MGEAAGCPRLLPAPSGSGPAPEGRAQRAGRGAQRVKGKRMRFVGPRLPPCFGSGLAARIGQRRLKRRTRHSGPPRSLAAGRRWDAGARGRGSDARPSRDGPLSSVVTSVTERWPRSLLSRSAEESPGVVGGGVPCAPSPAPSCSAAARL